MMKLHFELQQAVRRYEFEHKVELTQQELADRIGMSRQTVSRWINGDMTRFNLDTLEKLCRALDCQPGDILKMIEVGDDEGGDDLE